MSTPMGPRPGGNAPKSCFEIDLDRHYTSKVYTSGSSISGKVIVNSPRDIAFDNFEISFTGTTYTRLDFVQQFPTQSHRQFMKLRMPLRASDLPETRVLKAGRTYTIPFNFVVPHSLALGSCNHPVMAPAVQEQHLLLPPSVGGWEGDDQAPDMAQVEYAIRVRVYKKPSPSAKQQKIAESSRMLKVLPSHPEDAPLNITFRDDRYRLSKSKTIRKGLFSAKTSKLTVSAAQPGAVMLSADGHRTFNSTAHVNVEFAPESVDMTPPKINSASAKLQALTFFSAVPVDDLPDLGSRGGYTANHSLSYSSTTTLFNNSPVGKVSWNQVPAASGRRDSGYSSSYMDVSGASDSDSRGKNKKTAPFKHITTLDIPISIPQAKNKKFFVPTFHSCLISRTYTLQLTLSVGSTNTTVTLSLPLQVGVETAYEPQGDELPSFESVMAQDEEDEVNAYFQPRVIHAPPPELQNGSMLPGYDGQLPAISVA